MITVRHETADDAPAVRELNERAFGGTAEADLVDRLRERGAVTLSLVAVMQEAVVGHAFFSPVEIAGTGEQASAVALGPMAVSPEYQQQGIGSRLVHDALDELQGAGHGLLVVLGHPQYYPRFGFVPAARFGLRCEFDAPDGAFMVLELRHGAWRGGSGTVRYQPEFHTV
jgi:putative acetyltransferase